MCKQLCPGVSERDRSWLAVPRGQVDARRRQSPPESQCLRHVSQGSIYYYYCCYNIIFIIIIIIVKPILIGAFISIFPNQLNAPQG